MIKKEQVIASFNKGATTYDHAARLQTKVAQNLALHMSGVAADKILEIGCGTGLLSEHLATLFPEANLLLTDIAPAMVDQCRRRFVNYEKINTACVDGEAIQLTDQFDLITSSMTLHWFKELNQSFDKILYKLKKGGRFMFAMLGENSLQEWGKLCEKFQLPAGTPHFPSVNQLQQRFPNFKFQVETINQTYVDAHDFLRVLKSLGATATRSEYSAVSPGKLRNALRHLSDEISMSYEIIYGDYIA